MSPPYAPRNEGFSIGRLKLWYGAVFLIFALFGLRLFYLQVIKHDYYRKAALSSQLKEYEIPAERGIIEAHDGTNIVPIVLNERRYTLFADPKFVADKNDAASKIAAAIGGNTKDYIDKMSADSRYSVLAKKLTSEQKDKLDGLKLKGIGTRETPVRIYPQGGLAAQVLGFVNDDGDGKYGIEQYLDSELKGQPGQLRAITDAQGVPLVSNPDNVIIQPEQGKKVVLTIDLSLQRRLEEILKNGLDAAHSTSGSAVIMDPNTGAIKAIANLPSFNPAEFFKVDDPSVFVNAAVGTPLEIGSSMKPLTVAAALDRGAIKPDSTYYDSGFVDVGDKKITNIEEDAGSGTRSIADILQLSLNTGAVWVLKQLGGGDINEQARVTWYDYLTNHYGFGQPTGVEQGYEAEGIVPDPKSGYGLGIQYANTAFGQGMSVTPLQMAAAFSSIVNGGTYYKPHLVDSLTDSKDRTETKKPQIIRDHVVSSSTSGQMRSLVEYVFNTNHVVYGMPKLRPEFSIGGKTGTAQVPKPGGGYYDDRYNGTFIGYVGGDKPQYVIFVRVNEPHIAGYAGARAAAPIFVSIVNTLINDFGVKPKGV